MAPRKSTLRMTPEERAEHERRYEETTKLLQSRIAYHRQKLAEERELEERRREAPGFLGRLRRRRAA